MSPRALRGPPLKFWFNHASCTTIHYMALWLGLTEGRDGCLPLLLGEAMAARVPVVGSDARGIKEVISLEETGLLFPSDDDNALAQALERLIKNHEFRNYLSRNAFLFVSQAHGLKQWVCAYERLFQSV